MVPEPEEPASYEAVDLGLPSGLKWATCNVGATQPHECGTYFSWGEIETKDWYSEDTYKFGKSGSISKYSTSDGITQLALVDDTARRNMGAMWHLPTKEDITELIENTTSEWVENYNTTGVSGRLFTGTNGNQIFIPASGCLENDTYLGVNGYCQMWSSSLSLNNDYRALCLYFSNAEIYRASDFRYYGFCVRGVK